MAHYWLRSRDKSPKRKSTLPRLKIFDEGLRIVMQNAWLDLASLVQTYRVSKHIQRLFSDFRIPFPYYGSTLYVPNAKVWEDIFSAWTLDKRHLGQHFLVHHGDALLNLLMYIDRTETGLYLMTSMKLHWTSFVVAIQINGRLSVYNEAKSLTEQLYGEKEKRAFLNVIRKTPHMFYVSGELCAYRGLGARFGDKRGPIPGPLLDESLKKQSAVAFAYCTDLMFIQRPCTKGVFEKWDQTHNRYGDILRIWYRLCKSRLVALDQMAKKWGYLPAIKLTEWLCDGENEPYAKFYQSLKTGI